MMPGNSILMVFVSRISEKVTKKYPVVSFQTLNGAGLMKVNKIIMALLTMQWNEIGR